MVLSPNYLTPDQQTVVDAPLDSRMALSGMAGTGKTTTGVERVMRMLHSGIPGNEVLLLFPQRTLATPYYDALQSPDTPAGGRVNVLTMGGLARRMVDLFWPLVGGEAGFTKPDAPPVFLTLETAQYYMAHLVRPLLREGYFESITLDRNRLYSQILDNLSKAAVNRFPHKEIGQRLKSAWVGDPAQAHVFDDAQECANLFREYCLEHNLLDFSLQLEVFLNQLWPYPLCQEILFEKYRHLVFDNLEEDNPATAGILQAWLPEFDSALLIYDLEAGYRRFLGADPESTLVLAELCEIQVRFEEGFVCSEEVSRFGVAMGEVLGPHPQPISLPAKSSGTFGGERGVKGGGGGVRAGEGVGVWYPREGVRFYPEMLDWVTEEIARLVTAGTAPGEIAVLAPYLSDALRYSLVDRLNRLGIPSRSHRPSRSLREEPATRCMLTLAKLAHPSWGLDPPRADVGYALMQAIEGMDLVRAQLLTQIVYRKGKLSSFEEIKPEVQRRITYAFGNLYEDLRTWLEAQTSEGEGEFDHFLSKMFGEILSQPGYGFHSDYNAGTVAANLVESAGKFRRVAGEVLAAEGVSLGQEYLQMVEEGVIAAQYLLPWQTDPEDAVFLAPAHTFLMTNRPVDYQFWLDVGSRGWYERLYQPLTHPYVLSHRWQVGQTWTDLEEEQAARESLYRLSLGLIRRCRRGICLGLSDLGEQGYEHKGELLRAIDKALRELKND